jgi:hypothetical protein
MRFVAGSYSLTGPSFPYHVSRRPTPNSFRARSGFPTTTLSATKGRLIRCTSSTLIFSRSRSVTSRRNREFSSCSSAIRSSAPRVRSGSVISGVATNAGLGPGGAVAGGAVISTAAG